MNTIEYFKERFDQLQALTDSDNGLATIRNHAFADFRKMGIPTVKHEEWKYTRISSLFNKEYKFPFSQTATLLTSKDLDAIRLPGHELANELVFVNGEISFSLSKVISAQLIVKPLEEAAANEYKDIVSKYFGHSANYLKDGIHALNTAFVKGGVFIQVKKGQALEYPVYIYNITDARINAILSQPRSLLHVSENAQVQLVETYITIGA
ncbi:MAG TPA: hypothetical protein VJ111_17910, partial [Chitinophagaceae bacterium]|nr:hypothetical protein [Chitinophagaceae bacterium]